MGPELVIKQLYHWVVVAMARYHAFASNIEYRTTTRLTFVSRPCLKQSLRRLLYSAT